MFTLSRQLDDTFSAERAIGHPRYVRPHVPSANLRTSPSSAKILAVRPELLLAAIRGGSRSLRGTCRLVASGGIALYNDYDILSQFG
jgi:hypothetical protein